MAIQPKERLPATAAAARARALGALCYIERDGAGSQQALRSALDLAPALTGPDRGLATELVYGVLRKRRGLDAWIGAASTHGLYKMQIEDLCALRLGAYQLAWLPRIPDFAAVHATVDAARSMVSARSLGFIHAVLRRLAREVAEGQRPDAPDLPPWIQRRIEAFALEVGQDPAAMAEAFCQPAPMHVHVLAKDLDGEAAEALRAEGVLLEPLEDIAIPGVWRSTGGGLFLSDAFAERRVVAQDAASVAVAEWLGVQPGEQVVDVAAGRGIKSLALAVRGGVVTAIDLDATKLESAAQLCANAGYPLHATQAADAAQDLGLAPATFDRVLVDAPCSGLGTLRRRPEIRHRRRATDLVRMSVLQQAILNNAAALCRPGGVLVFATCSFAPEEGPLVVDDFLRQHPEFHRDSGQQAWVAPLLDARGDLRSHPLIGGMDAFYAARLVRDAS